MNTALTANTDLSPELALLCAALQNSASDSSADWPAQVDAGFGQRLLAQSNRHGVQALIYHRLKSQAAWRSWPDDVRRAFADCAHAAAATELLSRRALLTVLDALAADGVRAILLKGVPLAYTHYPTPGARPHADVDLLIDPAHAERTRQVLIGLDYRCPPIRGRLANCEINCAKAIMPGYTHIVEPHWGVNQRLLFAQSLTFDRAEQHSVPVPALGQHAACLAPAQALLVACMHRASTLFDSDSPGERLIWLYDIHLLLGRMSPAEINGFTELAVNGRVGAVCLDALRECQRHLDSDVPEALTQTLAGAGDDLSAAYLGKPSTFTAVLTNFRALGWRCRARLFAEYLLPPPDYLLARYGAAGRSRLPILYLRHGFVMIKQLAGWRS